MLILAIDQGTTNTKALVFQDNGEVINTASASCHTHYPEPGWAEQSATEIWQTTQEVIREACRGRESEISAIGISNQRETLVVWNAETGEPVGPAPIWQCRRTSEACAKLIDAGLSDEVSSLTGLGINPLFPASKLAWIVQHRTEAQQLLQNGLLRAGTVDAWLIWKLTAGSVFATDHSNASRTMLFDTATLAWSPKLAEIFSVQLECLPEPRASDAHFGNTAAGVTALPAGIPIRGVLGDSHAALYGHGVRQAGVVKATYGTGSSLMTLTDERVGSQHGLSGTIAWTTNNQTAYALEGNITVSAQAAAFISDLVDTEDAAALSKLAESVPDANGVTFVPALAGLGAPHWVDDARGQISGLSLGTTRAHLARATFEAIAHQVADVLDALEEDLGRPLAGISADGGASANPFLMQLQADLLGLPVQRRSIAEIGAYGIAHLCAESLGASFPFDKESEVFEAAIDASEREKSRKLWKQAILSASQFVADR